MLIIMPSIFVDSLVVLDATQEEVKSLVISVLMFSLTLSAHA